MAKASKPKNQQHKNKSPRPRVAQLPSPEARLAAATAQAPTDIGATDVQEAALAPATGETAPELMSKAAALQALRTAQLAKQPQSKQWKQQLKAGKMVGAQVPKRFNRGG